MSIKNNYNTINIKLPTNKKFGFFFSAIFFIFGSYFIYSSNNIIGYLLIILALIFFLIAIIDSNLLTPLNKIWMQFGLLLSKIVSPIILGIIFFGLITPYSFVMKIFGRDELRLKKFNHESDWIIRKDKTPQTDFKRQF